MPKPTPGDTGIRWIEEYRCGCASDANKKKDLLGYCKHHGESRRGCYKIPAPGSIKKGGGK